MIIRDEDDVDRLVESGRISLDEAVEIQRFQKFLRFVGRCPGPDGEPVKVSPETYRYAHGEDVEPTPPAGSSPADDPQLNRPY